MSVIERQQQDIYKHTKSNRRINKTQNPEKLFYKGKIL